MKLSRFIYFFILISLFSCRHDLERTNPLDPNNPDYMPPEIALLSPVGGEEVLLGSTIEISWSSINVSNVNIELFKDDVLFQVLTTNLENNFSFQWEVIGSNTDILGSNFKIRITSSDNSDIFSQSNNNFTIYQTPIGPSADITINSPVTDVYTIGETIDIEWTATGIDGSISIYLYQNGNQVGNTSLGGMSLSASSSPYSWYIAPQIYEAGNNYIIKIVSDNNPSVYAESEAFQLKNDGNPSITVNAPSGGQYTLGNTIPISWNTTDITTGLVVIMLKQNGQNIHQIAYNIPYNNSTYSWYIDPNQFVAGNNYTINITYQTDASVYDESNSFSLLNPPPPPVNNFTFFDDFSNQNIKIYPNIDLGNTTWSSFINPNCFHSYVSSGGITTSPSLLGYHVADPLGYDYYNTIRFHINDILPAYASVKGTAADPLIIEMDFQTLLWDFGAANYDDYYGNQNFRGGYGFELIDEDTEMLYLIFVASYSRELSLNIIDYSIYPSLQVLPLIPSAYFGSMSGITSIQLEYDGSSFKITAPNGNVVTENSNLQYYNDIDFETIGFIFWHEDITLTVTGDTYFDNFDMSGVGVDVKKSNKNKSNSFLDSRIRKIQIPLIK